MAQITLKNAAGKDAGKVELVEDVFGIQPNVPLMHQVVTAQLARRRSGTQSTKTRAEVRGGGAKPYRQKGTGNARQGSTNSPHYTGGGVALGPKPRSYAQRTPKKMIKLALRSALSDRANDGKVLVIDAWNFETPSTKNAAAAIRALGAEGRVLVVLERENTNAALSFRNIPEIQLIQAGELNAYDVLCNDWVVFTQGSLSFVEQGFAAFAAARSKGGAKNGAAKTIKAEKPARAAKPATADKPAKPAKAEQAEAEQAEAEQAEAVVETTEAVVEVPLDAEADAIDEPSDTTVDDSEGEDEA
jgi:large subunit ribosomal protein L4